MAPRGWGSFLGHRQRGAWRRGAHTHCPLQHQPTHPTAWRDSTHLWPLPEMLPLSFPRAVDPVGCPAESKRAQFPGDKDFPPAPEKTDLSLCALPEPHPEGKELNSHRQHQNLPAAKPAPQGGQSRDSAGERETPGIFFWRLIWVIGIST